MICHGGCDMICKRSESKVDVRSTRKDLATDQNNVLYMVKWFRYDQKLGSQPSNYSTVIAYNIL